jgi:hypothetical protein
VLYSLDNPTSAAINADGLNALRASDEEWGAFKTESTVAEVSTIDLLCAIFACRDGILHQGNYDLDVLAENLRTNIPFPGLDSNDINWEILHAAWLTVQV